MNIRRPAPAPAPRTLQIHIRHLVIDAAAAGTGRPSSTRFAAAVQAALGDPHSPARPTPAHAVAAALHAQLARKGHLP